MAKLKEFIVTIGTDGSESHELKGFDDGGCLKESEPLEKALGGKLLSRNKKVEALKPPVQLQTLGKKE